MTTQTAGNFRQSELDRFGALAARWWDPDGPQKPLHALNPVRLQYVADRVPLAQSNVLDVGCGAGLLSEAMALAGAQVTALDLAPELVKVARLHAMESGATVDYRVQPVEEVAAAAPGFSACAQALNPGGRLFVSTINRTPAAFALAIVGAEYVARLLPKGTHQYRDFVRPSELAAWLRAAGLELEDVSGLMYMPLLNSARLGRRTDVNYIVSARKPA